MKQSLNNSDHPKPGIKERAWRPMMSYIAAVLCVILFYCIGVEIGKRSSNSDSHNHQSTNEIESTGEIQNPPTSNRHDHWSSTLDLKEIRLLAVDAEAGNRAAESALTESINRLSFVQAADWLATLLHESNSYGSDTIIRALQTRLAELDAARTIQYALSTQKGEAQMDLMLTGFHHLTLTNVDSAIDQANSLEDPTFVYIAKQGILAAMGQQSPKQALQFALEQNLVFYNNGSEAMMRGWVERDIAGATAALLDFDTDYVWPSRIHLFEAICQKSLLHDPDSVLSLWKQLLKDDYRLASTYMASDMVHAWSAIDPRAAIEFIQNQEDARGQGNLTRIPLKSWLVTDPAAAAQWLLEQEDKGLQISIIDQLWTSALKNVSAETMLELVECVPPSERRNNLWEATIRNLEAHNTPALLEWINAQPDDRARNRAMWQYADLAQNLNVAKMNLAKQTFANETSANWIARLMLRWAKEEPVAAWDWIQNQQQDRFYPELVGQYSEQLAATDPTAALSVVRQISDSRIRSRYTNEIIKEMIYNQPELALNWIQRELHFEERDQALLTYINNYKGNQPEQALMAIHSLSEAQKNELSYAEILSRIETDQAINFVRRLQTESKPVSSLITLVAARDPQLAIQLLNDPILISTSNANIPFLKEIIVKQWAQSDKSAAVNWALSFPVVDGKNQALNEALSVICRDQYNIAFAKDIVEKLPLESARDSAILEIRRRLTYHDPKGTYEWAVQHGSESTQAEIVKVVTDELLRRDSIDASTWVNTLPEGPTRDSGVIQILNSLRDTSPGEAFPWALSLSDKPTSMRYLRGVVDKWKQVDPDETYRTIYYSSELSTSEKESLLRGFE